MKNNKNRKSKWYDFLDIILLTPFIISIFGYIFGFGIFPVIPLNIQKYLAIFASILFMINILRLRKFRLLRILIFSLALIFYITLLNLI